MESTRETSLLLGTRWIRCAVWDKAIWGISLLSGTDNTNPLEQAMQNALSATVDSFTQITTSRNLKRTTVCIRPDVSNRRQEIGAFTDRDDYQRPPDSGSVHWEHRVKKAGTPLIRESSSSDDTVRFVMFIPALAKSECISFEASGKEDISAYSGGTDTVTRCSRCTAPHCRIVGNDDM
eukprot:586297-Pelagomonas_calceolata.AAC.5